MSRHKSKSELLSENQRLRTVLSIKIAETLGSILKQAIKYGAAICVAYYIYMSIEALAGQETNANFILKFLGSVTITHTLSLIFGFSGISYGFFQKKLRKSVIENTHGRIKSLEEGYDENRSSSELTKSGDTRPEDE